MESLTPFRSLSAASFFLYTALVFGLAMLFITPPYQVPDEVHHFTCAYQISEGRLFPETQDNRLGGHIPTSIINSTLPLMDVRFLSKDRTSTGEILTTMYVPLNPDSTTFYDFPNTALYSPVPYIPQAITIFTARLLGLPLLFIFYLSRLVTFLTWVICIYYAIKILPAYQWLFALLALLPMSLYTNMSLSADVVTNAVSFLLIAYILKCAFSGEAFTRRDFWMILGLTFLLAGAKTVYTPLILLFFIIPLKKFKDRKVQFLNFAAIALVGGAIMVLSSQLVSHIAIPGRHYNAVAMQGNIDLNPNVDVRAQMNYVTDHLYLIPHVYVASLAQAFNIYFRGYIGTFGWLDTYLPMWMIVAGYLVILAIAIMENDNASVRITPAHKTILFIALNAMTGLLILSQYLTWQSVGDDHVWLLQGRYFVPVFPLLFMLLRNTKLNAQKLVAPTVIAFTLLILSYSLITLYSRYYHNLPIAWMPDTAPPLN